jgi:aminomethyltransferase
MQQCSAPRGKKFSGDYTENMTASTPGYTALRETAAWVDVSARGRIKMTGEDRARLLHAMCTNNIQKLEPGQGCYAFFLNAQGRILADVRVWCFADYLLLDTEPETRQKIYEHLARYIIADDVTHEDVTGQTDSIVLQGPNTHAPALADLWSHTPWGDGDVQTTPLGRTIIGPQGKLLANKETIDDATQATLDDLRVVRIEHGVPRYGEEITERYLVQETGLLDAVSFSKGCYLGQEIVERVRSRAQVHRHLRLIEIDTDQVPAAGEKVLANGADAGEIASAVYSYAWGKVAAMAYMRTPASDPGTELTWNGATSRVRALPRL